MYIMFPCRLRHDDDFGVGDGDDDDDVFDDNDDCDACARLIVFSLFKPKWGQCLLWLVPTVRHAWVCAGRHVRIGYGGFPGPLMGKR